MTTKLTLATALRALASHIERHQLAECDVLGIKFSHGMRGGLVVQVYGTTAFRAWCSSLDDVTAEACVYEGTIQVRAMGQRANLPMSVIGVVDPDRDATAYAELFAVMSAPDSGKDEPVLLPAALGGALPIADRVAAGIELLDRKLPGWDARIDLDTLTLDSCKRCVLGQLFVTYSLGLGDLDLDDDDAVGLGFDLHSNESDALYDKLTDTWFDAIRGRRQAVTG